MVVRDKIINTLMGSNIKTVRVTALQLAELIYNNFVNEEKNATHISKILKGRFFLYTDIDSADKNYHLHISHFRRGLTVHRVVWIKRYETEEVFEWKGYTLRPLKKAFLQWSAAVRTAGRKGNTDDNIYIYLEKSQKKKRVYRLCTIAVLLVLVSIPGYLWYSDYVAERERVAEANKMITAADVEMKNGNYSNAYELYGKAGKYANKETMMNCLYMMVKEACALGNQPGFVQAENICKNITGIKKEEASNLIRESKYNVAVRYYNDGLYINAETFFDLISGNYKEKEAYLEKITKITEAMESVYGTYEFSTIFQKGKTVKQSVISLVDAYNGKEGLNYTVLSYTKTKDEMELKLKNKETGETIKAVYLKDFSTLLENKETSYIAMQYGSRPCIYLEDPAAGSGFYLKEEELGKIR